MKFKRRILENVGCQPEVWRGKSFRKLARDVRDAMNDDEFLALVGKPGCGKKTVVNAVCMEIEEENKRGLKPFHHIVHVQSMDKERIRIGQIANAIIFDMSDERPRRDPEARTRQLARILGRAVVGNGEKVTVIVGQAHRLHPNTIRAIKELRELTFLGRMDLFGVVLIGHPPLKGRIENLNDVILRVEIEVMDEAHGWMSGAERREYLKTVFGGILTPSMREQISMSCNTPLEMDRLIYNKMKEVFLRGSDHFEEADFMLELKTVIEKSGLSYDKIARATPRGLSKATVGQVVNGKYDNPEVIAEVRATIARLTAGKEKEAAA